MEKVKKVAAFPTSVFITGDSGTGKEVLANYIHQYSPQKDTHLLKSIVLRFQLNYLSLNYLDMLKEPLQGPNKEGRLVFLKKLIQAPYS
ncbi:sigma 54-interacting transcriptional regulator [Peribacillus butanolivorans]